VRHPLQRLLGTTSAGPGCASRQTSNGTSNTPPPLGSRRDAPAEIRCPLARRQVRRVHVSKPGRSDLQAAAAAGTASPGTPERECSGPWGRRPTGRARIRGNRRHAEFLDVSGLARARRPTRTTIRILPILPRPAGPSSALTRSRTRAAFSNSNFLAASRIFCSSSPMTRSSCSGGTSLWSSSSSGTVT